MGSQRIEHNLVTQHHHQDKQSIYSSINIIWLADILSCPKCSQEVRFMPEGFDIWSYSKSLCMPVGILNRTKFQRPSGVNQMYYGHFGQYQISYKALYKIEVKADNLKTR